MLKINALTVLALAIGLSSIASAQMPTLKYSSCSINTVSDVDESGKQQIAVWGILDTSGNRALVTGRRYIDNAEGGLAVLKELESLKQSNICFNNDGTGLLTE